MGPITSSLTGGRRAKSTKKTSWNVQLTWSVKLSGIILILIIKKIKCPWSLFVYLFKNVLKWVVAFLFDQPLTKKNLIQSATSKKIKKKKRINHHHHFSIDSLIQPATDNWSQRPAPVPVVKRNPSRIQSSERVPSVREV
jgi:hypothetical protein